jgi:alkylation response protein AidB-like acyl-CoA dehydrogenase
MDFTLSEDQKMLRDMVQRFSEDQLQGAAVQADAQGRLNPSTVVQLRELGLLGLADEDGDLGFAAVALYELARHDAATAFFVGQHCAASAGIAAAGADAGATFTIPVFEDLVLDEEAGEIIARSPGFVVPFLDHANALVFPVRLSGRAALARASSHVLGETQPFRALGVCAAGFEKGELEGQVIETFGDDEAVEVFETWRILTLAAVASGVARASKEAGTLYASERVQFGKALSEFQATQFKVADMALRADAAWLMLMRAASRSGARDNNRMVKNASRVAIASAMYCSDEALQLHGGYGYTREYAIERYYRDARALSSLV